jgi:hypothetical protein
VEASAVVEPLSPDRYKVQFTGSKGLCAKLERLRALMRHEVPHGDLAAIIEKAVSEKLERMEAKRYGTTARTRRLKADPAAASASSRHIPAAVRRAVLKRDHHRCRYVDGQGRRCPERRNLEYHHRDPFAMGGDHGVENIRLMCHAHNAYLAEHDYGRKAMARYRESRGNTGGRGAGEAKGPSASWEVKTDFTRAAASRQGWNTGQGL